MRFLVDAQLPPALARFIRGTGHDCDHVGDVGLLVADDSPIWLYADTHACVIVTKDEDFQLRKALARAGPRIVWLRVRNCSNRALIAWFQPLWPEIIKRLDQGDELIEVV